MTIDSGTGEIRFVDGPQGRTAIVDGLWREDFSAAIRSDPTVVRLSYSPGLGVKCDLRFLRGLPQIRKFGFGHADKCDVSALSECPTIEIATIGDSPGSVEFHEMPSLRRIYIAGKRHATAALAATQLHELLWDKVPFHDLTSLGNLVELRQLSLRGGALVSTRGVGRLRSLEILGLDGHRKLREIVDLIGLQRLRKLAIDACPALPDFEEVGALSSLEDVEIQTRGETPSITPLRACRKLRRILMTNVRIQDGKIAFLLELPCLSSARVSPAKGYDMSYRELYERALERRVDPQEVERRGQNVLRHASEE